MTKKFHAKAVHILMIQKMPDLAVLNELLIAWAQGVLIHVTYIMLAQAVLITYKMLILKEYYMLVAYKMLKKILTQADVFLTYTKLAHAVLHVVT